jgi:hypothetical protein
MINDTNLGCWKGQVPDLETEFALELRKRSNSEMALIQRSILEDGDLRYRICREAKIE